MANTFAYAQLFQSALDKQIEQQAVTAYLEPAASQVKYNGGNTVKLPDITVDGLANYSRATGHVQGNVTLNWTDYTLTQDRGRSFQIDTMDVDETNFVATAGAVMSEFQRLKVIPEIDSYRLAFLAGKAVTAGQVVDGSALATTPEEALDALFDDLATIEDRIGSEYRLRVHLSPLTRRWLSASTRAANLFEDAVLTQGNLDVRFQAINGALLIPTPQARLNTGITIDPVNGWEPTTGAKQVNWLIVAEGLPLAVSKTDVPRVFDPLTNQAANAWKVDYRKYHDIWLPKNKIAGVQVNTGATIA